MQGEASSVVKKEKRSAVLGVVVDRADSEFIAYAVAAAHELCTFCVIELVCLLYLFSSALSVCLFCKMIGNVALI